MVTRSHQPEHHCAKSVTDERPGKGKPWLIGDNVSSTSRRVRGVVLERLLRLLIASKPPAISSNQGASLMIRASMPPSAPSSTNRPLTSNMATRVKTGQCHDQHHQQDEKFQHNLLLISILVCRNSWASFGRTMNFSASIEHQRYHQHRQQIGGQCQRRHHCRIRASSATTRTVTLARNQSCRR